jgi:hypothetical protein
MTEVLSGNGDKPTEDSVIHPEAIDWPEPGIPSASSHPVLLPNNQSGPYSSQRMRVLKPLLPLHLITSTISTDYLLADLRLNERTSVEFFAGDVPIDGTRDKNRNKEHTRIIHILRGSRAHRRQNEDNAHEQRPQARPRVHKFAEFAQVPWAWDEFSEEKLAHDGDDVAPVQSDGAHIENAGDSGVGAQADEIDGDAPEDGDPHGEQGSAGAWVDAGPQAGCGDQLIPGESKDRSSEGLRGGEADELQDDKGTDCVDDAARFAEGVVEDLRDGLEDRGGENGYWVAHDEAEDNVEEEARDVGEGHSERDRPRGFEFGFGDSGGWLVIRGCR